MLSHFLPETYFKIKEATYQYQGGVPVTSQAVPYSESGQIKDGMYSQPDTIELERSEPPPEGDQNEYLNDPVSVPISAADENGMTQTQVMVQLSSQDAANELTPPPTSSPQTTTEPPSGQNSDSDVQNAQNESKSQNESDINDEQQATSSIGSNDG